ncbi:MAG: transglycosylase domain-containing protein [Saprospiraceae bacterium]|nr:transglycosylase domain-containing protein [Saprospiraceae bacterium]
MRLERKYTKEEIMAMYLNKFDFLYDSYGIKSASRHTLAKGPGLAQHPRGGHVGGHVEEPIAFQPEKKTGKATQRRSVVLDQMRKNRILSQEEYDSG